MRYVNNEIMGGKPGQLRVTNRVSERHLPFWGRQYFTYHPSDIFANVMYDELERALLESYRRYPEGRKT